MTAGEKETVGTLYTYQVDDRDRITAVSDNWDTFAEANGAPDLCLSSNVLGTKLWDHIHDWETGHIYENLLAKVRDSGKSISVPIRCDAPAVKRHIDVRMKPLQDGSVAFICRIVALEPRAAVKLLSESVPRSDELLRICSFCKQIDLGQDQWVETETGIAKLGLFNQPALPGLTHTICPACMTLRYGDDD